MDLEILSRAQFAMNIAFHYIFPPLSIGLGLILVIMESTYLITKNRLYEEMTKFWVKIFALIFALGIATGVIQIFGFGTNWANFSRFVGDVFGSALGAEGVFAFFLEAGFLAILLFGWNRVSPKVHLTSTILVCLGAHFSAIWIVVANSWMQTPAGYEIIGEGAEAHAVITNFKEMLLNHSTLDRLAHVIIGCWIAGAFLVISVSAFYLLKKRHRAFSLGSMKIGLMIGTIALLFQGISGDSTGRGVAVNQPVKLAAFEGLFQTQNDAPMSIIGYVDSENETVKGLAIPGLLSFLVARDFSATVTGLDQFPKEDWPNVSVVYQTYHLMIFMWGLMLIAAIVGLWQWKKKLWESKWALYLLIVSVLFPQIANQAGWFSAEMGRQPWIVYGVLRTSEGLSFNVSADQVLASIIMFAVIYVVLFALFVFLLNHKIQQGPSDPTELEPLFAKDFFQEKQPHVPAAKQAKISRS